MMPNIPLYLGIVGKWYLGSEKVKLERLGVVALVQAGPTFRTIKSHHCNSIDLDSHSSCITCFVTLNYFISLNLFPYLVKGKYAYLV